MADPKLLTAERLRELLHYDEATGIFTRLTAPGGKYKAGEKVGYYTAKGYIANRIDQKPYQIHRLAWLWMTGEWPAGEIDHINGIKDDNRVANLRDVDGFINQQNKYKARKDNKSTGVLGVFIDKSTGKIRARIQHNGKEIHLGRFSTVEAAHEAYLKAKRELHPGCEI